jgi:hypothetical protein
VHAHDRSAQIRTKLNKAEQIVRQSSKSKRNTYNLTIRTEVNAILTKRNIKHFKPHQIASKHTKTDQTQSNYINQASNHNNT